MMKHNKQILLVALGGNALIRKGQKGTVDEQFENLKTPVRQIANLSRTYRTIITHGNGPQVGDLMLKQECCDAVPKLPLEILVAQTQGQIGYMIESTLDTELMLLGDDSEHYFVSLLSYVVVDKNDPAFLNPSKPVGPVFTKEKAQTLPYPTKETARGYRRVVASPLPVTIVEKREIKKLIGHSKRAAFQRRGCGYRQRPFQRQAGGRSGRRSFPDCHGCSRRRPELWKRESKVPQIFNHPASHPIFNPGAFPYRFHGTKNRSRRPVCSKNRQKSRHSFH